MPGEAVDSFLNSYCGIVESFVWPSCPPFHNVSAHPGAPPQPPVHARLAMSFWGLPDDSAGGLRDAFKTYRHGAAQPVAGDAPECVGVRVVSFNFGMPQTMLESSRQWNNKHVFKFRDLLNALGPTTSADFVFCSEVGDARKGFHHTSIDVGHIVSDAVANADFSTRGAYLSLWNIRNKATFLVQEGTWTATSAHNVDMHWQAFDLTYRDASQLAGKVGVLVGNMHIPVGKHPQPTLTSRKRFVQTALEHLSRVDVGGWRGRDNFPVLRILVGDCNMGKDFARSCTQGFRPPPLTPLQKSLELDTWQVCDVLFPRQALDSARTQNTQMFRVAISVWTSLVFWP